MLLRIILVAFYVNEQCRIEPLRVESELFDKPMLNVQFLLCKSAFDLAVYLSISMYGLLFYILIFYRTDKQLQVSSFF